MVKISEIHLNEKFEGAVKTITVNILSSFNLSDSQVHIELLKSLKFLKLYSRTLLFDVRGNRISGILRPVIKNISGKRLYVSSIRIDVLGNVPTQVVEVRKWKMVEHASRLVIHFDMRFSESVMGSLKIGPLPAYSCEKADAQMIKGQAIFRMWDIRAVGSVALYEIIPEDNMLVGAISLSRSRYIKHIPLSGTLHVKLLDESVCPVATVKFKGFEKTRAKVCEESRLLILLPDLLSYSNSNKFTFI